MDNEGTEEEVPKAYNDLRFFLSDPTFNPHCLHDLEIVVKKAKAIAEDGRT